MNIKHNEIFNIGEKELLRYFNDSGIKSIMEIQIITPDANEQEAAMMVDWFLIFINIGIKPIKVAKPARDVKINGYNINDHLINIMQLVIKFI